jgi:hypothetical protein
MEYADMAGFDRRRMIRNTYRYEDRTKKKGDLSREMIAPCPIFEGLVRFQTTT